MSFKEGVTIIIWNDSLERFSWTFLLPSSDKPLAGLRRSNLCLCVLLHVTMPCLSLWFCSINEGHQLFSLCYNPASERMTLATKRIWVSENDDDGSGCSCNLATPWPALLGLGSFEPPFFSFSSRTLPLCSASFLPAATCSGSLFGFILFLSVEVTCMSLAEGLPLQALAEGWLVLLQS